MGFTYAAFTASAKEANVATRRASTPRRSPRGKQIYQTACITCHGANLQGVLDRGPSLVGVGQAAAYFQLSTGRMPAAENGAQIRARSRTSPRRRSTTLAAYIQANGGGPVIPDGDLRNNAEISPGGELFRLNCASCHNFTGQGGALSQGKYAPNLEPGHRPADLRRHAQRPAEHAQVR